MNLDLDPQVLEQIAPYQPWLILGGVFVLFLLLRVTRRALRRRVDTIGHHLFGERGLLIWFWVNAPGVIIHEFSHALAVLFFYPFGFRLTRVTPFRIKPLAARGADGRVMRKSGPQSLQLGEVQYVRPQGRVMSHIGDGVSGIAPLFGGTLAFVFLYWVCTGYNLWDLPMYTDQGWRFIRPDWPWWTLLFAPYLILTVTSELWPSRQDWYGARYFVIGLSVMLLILVGLLWYSGAFVTIFPVILFIAGRVDFALFVLLCLDLVFLIIAEALVRVVRG